MKIFKGKYKKLEKGDKFKRFSQKSFRKTGKNLINYDPETIYLPKNNRHHSWFD
jgi:hypothetical protein